MNTANGIRRAFPRLRWIAFLALVAACGKAARSSTSGDTLSALTCLGQAVVPTQWTTPDTGNVWATGFTPQNIGDENILSSEDATFAQMATEINGMQAALESRNGGLARG